MYFHRTSLLLLPFSVTALTAQTNPQVAPQQHATTDLNIDSGPRDNTGPVSRVVFKKTIRVAQSEWLQLRFGNTTNLPQGSSLRITSLTDGANQQHDGETLETYSMWTAGFNGDSVLLELIAGARTSGNRVSVDQAMRGRAAQPGLERICGTDDRIPSNDKRVGRLGNGCTGFLAGQLPLRDADLMLGSSICRNYPYFIEFNVPDSSPNGAIVRSDPRDQYPYKVFRSGPTRLGEDWMVCYVGRNSTTGLLPTEANGGAFFELGTVPSSTAGERITVPSYGTTDPRNSRSQTQQTDTAPILSIRAQTLTNTADTSAGSAGAPAIQVSTGKVIGIENFTSCSATGGVNFTLRIDHPGLQRALSVIRRVFRPYGSGCAGSGRAPNQCVKINRAGGTLTKTFGGASVAYEGFTPRPLQCTGVSVFAAARGTSDVIAPVDIWIPNRTVGPAIQLKPGGFMTFKPQAGFYRSNFNVTIPAGRFFIMVGALPGTDNLYHSDLTTGDLGRAFQPILGTGLWDVTPRVKRPSYRVHCVGDGQPNAVPGIGNVTLPRLGETFSMVLYHARANAPAALMFGSSNQQWAGGNLPWSLRTVGAPGCSLHQSAELFLTGLTTDAAGELELPLAIPNQPSLFGVGGFCQFYIVDPGNNPAGLAVTHGVALRVGG